MELVNEQILKKIENYLLKNFIVHDFEFIFDKNFIAIWQQQL